MDLFFLVKKKKLFYYLILEEGLLEFQYLKSKIINMIFYLLEEEVI